MTRDGLRKIELSGEKSRLKRPRAVKAGFSIRIEPDIVGSAKPILTIPRCLASRPTRSPPRLPARCRARRLLHTPPRAAFGTAGSGARISIAFSTPALIPPSISAPPRVRVPTECNPPSVVCGTWSFPELDPERKQHRPSRLGRLVPAASRELDGRSAPGTSERRCGAVRAGMSAETSATCVRPVTDAVLHTSSAGRAACTHTPAAALPPHTPRPALDCFRAATLTTAFLARASCARPRPQGIVKASCECKMSSAAAPDAVDDDAMLPLKRKRGRPPKTKRGPKDKKDFDSGASPQVRHARTHARTHARPPAHRPFRGPARGQADRLVTVGGAGGGMARVTTGGMAGAAQPHLRAICLPAQQCRSTSTPWINATSP